MRFLKKKVLLSLLRKERLNANTLESKSCEPKKSIKKRSSGLIKKTHKTQENEKKLSTKNIIKNYSRAIGNFAMSELFLPYVSEDPLVSGLVWSEFVGFCKTARDTIQNIENLREYLIINEDEVEKVAAFKTLFKKAAVIFIKYFSVNWIFSAKLIYKQTYVQYRGNLLRGIMDPMKLTITSARSK